jgi:NADH-quinone oxidoreductase subunit L
MPVWLPEIANSEGMLVLLGILLLAGPIGKSAQFPLHEWLPEAMAGPGPVSALIHAATMVKSGVYLVARLLPIFYYGTWVIESGEAEVFFHMTAWVGAITAFVAASQGMVALELKKALAYSTVSQIGYMMLALGVAGLSPDLLLNGYTAGLFHLMSHALFKACLFLCAGSVIHSVHSIYMHEMGGVRKYMRKTWIFMMIASLSLMGLPGSSGFWSKDLVLMTTIEANLPLFVIGIVTAGITAFYTVRMIGMVFYGAESDNVHHLKRDGHAPHEAHPTMWFACGVLAVAILGTSVFGRSVEHLLHDGMNATLITGLSLPAPAEAQAAFPGWLVPVLSGLVLLAGVIPGYLLYIKRKRKRTAAEIVAGSHELTQFHKFLWKRWHIDGFYNWFFVKGTRALARLVGNVIEDRFDDLVHRQLPKLVTRKSFDALQHMRTETGAIVTAVTYIMLVFVFFLFIFFLVSGG